MQIGIDLRCLMHKNYSGVAEYTYNLLDNLFQIDSQNQYKLFYNSNHDVSINLPNFDYGNVEFIGFKYPNKFLNFSFKFFNYPKIDLLLKNIDIFFIPNLNFLALSKKCKKMITVHDLSFELFPDFFSKKRIFWHKFIKPKKIISNCEKIIAVSENTKNDLINLYQLTDNKIKIIYSGIDQQIYKKLDNNLPNFQKIKNKYKLPENFILYLGTIEPRKNIEGIIEAFNLLKTRNNKLANLNLVIAGNKGWNYDKVFQLAKNSNFSKQIKFTGYIDRKDKPYLYNLAQIFIFPSFYEGFGLPVLEAQACGTPVIASANSSFPEILKNSAFLVKPDNLSEISQAILQILNNQKLKENLINQGLKNSQRFTWQKTAQQTLDYLSS